MTFRLRGAGALLASLIAGCASAPASPPRANPAGAARAPDVSGVRVDAVAEIAGLAPAAWAFITTDLHQIGQPELVLLVKRAPGEGDNAYPAEGLEILSSLAKAVKKGRHFEEWELAGIPEGMLGRRDLTGIVLGGPLTDSRVKVAGPTVTVLLITQDELDVAFHFGAPRVTNLLARHDEFFPYPPWVDRNRKSVCTPAEMKGSPVARIGTRQWIGGAAVWQDLHAQPRRIVLDVTRDAGRKIAKTLREVDANRIAFFPLAPGDDADARMVFSKLGEDPIAVSRSKNGDAAKIAGVFVVFASSEDESGAVVTEDGFSVFIPAPRWADGVTALEAGRPFDVAAGKNTLPFSIGSAK